MQSGPQTFEDQNVQLPISDRYSICPWSTNRPTLCWPTVDSVLCESCQHQMLCKNLKQNTWLNAPPLWPSLTKSGAFYSTIWHAMKANNGMNLHNQPIQQSLLSSWKIMKQLYRLPRNLQDASHQTTFPPCLSSPTRWYTSTALDPCASHLPDILKTKTNKQNTSPIQNWSSHQQQDLLYTSQSHATTYKQINRDLIQEGWQTFSIATYLFYIHPHP